jgi:lysophospholipase L1-like esterase
MCDHVREPVFEDLLSGVHRLPWTAILLSGGGNDLIDALGQPPKTTDLAHRLLLTDDEWRSEDDGPDRYLSASGWQTFSGYISNSIATLMALRDQTPENRGIPILMHTYDLAVPRPAGAWNGVAGPWLYPAVHDEYGIPEGDWAAVARLLLVKLKTLLLHIADSVPDRSLYVVDTQGILAPASTDDPGPTADWENEIHPTDAGYAKLSPRWSEKLVELFDQS